MDIGRAHLDEAVARGIVSGPQAEALWALLARKADARSPSRLNGLNVAYYFGALLVIGAMGWLMTLAAQNGWGVFALAVCYAALFVLAARPLLAVPATRVPGGLLVTMAVCMTPLAVYGLQRATQLWPHGDPGDYRGFFPYIRSGWFFMEVCTGAAAIVAVRNVRFPFLIAPLAVVLWFMSMDLAALLAADGRWNQDLFRRVSIVFGVGMMFAAYLLDHRTRQDFSFWLYLFGMLSFWTALTTLDSGSELRRFLYCLMNLGFIVGGTLVRRRVFLVFGAFGVNLYLVRLSYAVFRDSVAFPFVLTLLGLSVIAGAVHYQKNRLRIEAWIDTVVPDWVRDLLPAGRAQYL